MVALIRALTSNAIANIEEALGMSDVTSSAMKQAIEEWYTAWYGREPTKMEDPCQRLPYAIVNKLCKATFGEYDSSLQHTNSGKLQYLDEVRSAFDAIKGPLMTQAMVGGEAWAKPVPMAGGAVRWQVVGRDSVIVLGRGADGVPTDVALCEKSVSADHRFFTLVERRTTDGLHLTVSYRLYCSDNKSTLGRFVPLDSLPQYAELPEVFTFSAPIDGIGMVFLRMPITNCVDGSADGVSVYEPAMGLIHRINQNELQLSREFELGRILKTISGCGQLSEMYSIDFHEDICIIGHSGSGDADISQAKKPTMKIVPVFHGKTGGGYLTQFYPPVGDVTYLGITQDKDGHFKFVVAEGVNEPGPIFTFGDTNMRTRFSCGAREFCNRWSEAGPTHHMAAAPGRHIDTILKVAKIFNVPVDIVTR